MREQRVKRYEIVIYGFIIIAMLGALFLYLKNASYNFPYMDFWIGLSDTLERFFNNGLEFTDVIHIPHALHSNVFMSIYHYIDLRYFNANILISIYGSLLAIGCSMILVAKIFVSYFRSSKIFFDIFVFTAAVIPLINLNQWEILTLYCSIAFTLRIFMYLLIFYLVDKNIQREEKRIKDAILISILSFIVISGMSQAYFPPLIIGVIGILVLDLIIKKGWKDRRVVLNYGIIILTNLGATFIWIVTLASGGMSSAGQTLQSISILEYCKGITIMLASVFIPQSMVLSEGALCLIGIIIFTISVGAVVLFFAKKMFSRSYFPLACLIYAFCSVIIIILGRISTYGLMTVTSSRYVIETTVGLIGLSLIMGGSIKDSFKKEKIKYLQMIVSLIIICLTIGAVWFCNYTERKIGPYRKAYCVNLEKLALDIDSVTDEELELFQAPAGEVRSGVSAMKKYKLGPWK